MEGSEPEPQEPQEPEEPEEPEVSAVQGEATAPKESDLPGSEGDGRHRVVTSCNCERLLRMRSATFNRALKILFIILLGTQVGYVLGLHIIVYAAHAVAWIVECFTINLTIVLPVAFFGLCVDVERPGFRPRPVPPWMVRLALWTHYKIKVFFYNMTTDLLPQHKAALRRRVRTAMDWINK